MTSTFYNTGLYGNSGTTSGSYYGTGLSTTSFWDTDYLTKKDDYNQAKEGIQVGSAARDAVMDKQISNFRTYLEGGKEDKALAAYEALIEEMSMQQRYANLSESQIQAIAKEIIEAELSAEAGQPVSLEDYIQEHAVGVNGQGWQKVFLNNNKIDDANAATLLNRICGMDEEEEMTVGQKILQGVTSVVLSPVKLITEIGDFLFGGNSH